MRSGKMIACVLVAMVLAWSGRAARGEQALFRIGEPDGSAAEFGLVKERWPAWAKTYTQPIVYTVGQSKVTDWPYVHPSTHDKWAGSKPHTFTIRFTAKDPVPAGLHLIIGTLAIWEPSEISIGVNGKQVASRRLPDTAKLVALASNPDGPVQPTPLVFAIPEGAVKVGDNELAITLNDGSWIIYDYVQLGSSAQPVAVKVAPGKMAKAGAKPQAAEPVGDLLPGFLSGAMKDVEEVVFAVHGIVPEHWYANIGYYSTDCKRPLWRSGGRLCKLNLRSGKVTLLVDDAEGGVRDPVVHYDGKQILFAWRKSGTDFYHLYVINSDGSCLRQVTDGNFDDYEPTWLPDGGITFVTTRGKRWVNCWLTQVGNIWRCDGEGRNMRALSANLEHDNTPWVMSDGRIMYMRWEYVDRSQVHYHHLWAMNPDGTDQTILFGNLHPGDVYIDAKPIPNSDKIVLSRSPGHGSTEHQGFLAVLNANNGPDDLANMKDISKKGHYRDPWAFSEDCFMAAADKRLVLMDGEGRIQTVYTLPAEYGDVWLHEPRPILAHAVERQIPSRVDLTQRTGKFLLENVTVGRNMAGVKPGEVKQLLVLESLPKPINFTGGMDPLSYKGTFTLERVLGTVPVEADGSAYFEAPALRSLLFVALDEHGKSVKRMQSFTTVQPGETLGCVGCHENRTAAPPTMAPSHYPMAVRRSASAIAPVAGVPELPDFPRDVQPVLDRHCVRCHNYDKREGGVVLTGDRGPMFSHSYYMLTVTKQLADGRNMAQSNYAPRALGSGGSPLMAKMEPGNHYDVKADEHERLMVRQWLEIGAPYPGTYASLGTGTIGGYIQNNQILNNDSDWLETKAAQPVFAQRCVSCHTGKHPVAKTMSDEVTLSFWAPNMDDPKLKHSRHIVFNLTAPAKSLILLAPLARSAGGYGLCKPDKAAANADSTVFATTDDPGYKLLLAMVENGKRQLETFKRFDMPGFKPRAEYVREMIKYGILPASFDLEKDAIDVYDTDRRYWESLWWKPLPKEPSASAR